MINKETEKFDTKRLVVLAMFTALAYVVGAFTGIIKVAFLSFDVKDAIITLAAFIYGPISGILIAFITALIESLTISGTGVYGFIMDFASSACFSAVAGLVYKLKRTPMGAIFSFLAASVTMVSVMMLLNMFVTPFYMMGESTYEATQDLVMTMIPTMILPFNIAKALLNTAVAMIIYKPLTMAMRRAHLILGSTEFKFTRSSAVMLVIAIVALALGIVIFILLQAKIDLSIFGGSSGGK